MNNSSSIIDAKVSQIIYVAKKNREIVCSLFPFYRPLLPYLIPFFVIIIPNHWFIQHRYSKRIQHGVHLLSTFIYIVLLFLYWFFLYLCNC